MWRFSLASSQALPGDIIFSLDLHFKFARDVGNEPIQEPDGEEHKVLEDDDETKSDSEDEEILTIEIVWLNRVKVLLVPGKKKDVKSVSDTSNRSDALPLSHRRFVGA